MRFLLYSHDAVGLGHVRRHLAIASALTQGDAEAQVLLATSVDEVSHLGLGPRIDTLKLPSLRKVANECYASRRLALCSSEIRALRSALLLATVNSFRPDVLLVDKHPLGAGGELLPALETAKATGTRVVLGLRDLLDEAAAVLKEWSAGNLQEVVSQFYDLVLIYGIDSVFNPITAYKFQPELAERTRFCGYVVNTPPPPPGLDLATGVAVEARQTPPVVLGTAGGGEDGFGLLETFIRSSAGAPWRAVAVAGPRLENGELAELQALGQSHGVPVHSFVPRLGNLFWTLDGLVCMGGYNTLAEAISTGLPTVCVPRVRPRSEQLLRAMAFQRLGLVQTIHPNCLTVADLRQAVSVAVSTPRGEVLTRARQCLTFDGTRQAAKWLKNLGARPETRPVERSETFAL